MLGSLRDHRAVDPLILAMRDPDVNVRHAAAASLGQIGAREAVPPLIDALTAEPWLQYPAIHALGEIADPRAAPALLELLGDEFFRGPALEALGRLADRDALPRIVPYLYDPEPALRNLAVRAVVEIEQRATAGGVSLDPEVQAALARGDLVDHLLQTLSDEDPHNRRTAVITLGWLKEARAEPLLIDLLAETGLQEYVSHALVSIGFRDPEAYRHGLEHADDVVRQGTVRCLAWIAPPSGIDLVAPLIHDPSPEVRAETAAAIGRLGDEDAAMLLFELLADESELIRESAMAALSRMAPERVVPLLLQALENPEEEVRIRAALTLGLVRDPGAVAALIAVSRDPRENVRRAVLKALGEIEGPDVKGLLRSALFDESSLVRQQAVQSLGQLQEPETADDLLPLLDDPDPRMRFVTLRALGQVRNASALPRLLPFLADPKKELRFAAVEALGAIRAVAAVAPLVEVLRDPDRNLRRAAAESLGVDRRSPGRGPSPPRPGGRALVGALRRFHGPRPDWQRQGGACPPVPPRRRRPDRPPRGGDGPGRDRGRARRGAIDPGPVRPRPAVDRRRGLAAVGGKGPARDGAGLLLGRPRDQAAAHRPRRADRRPVGSPPAALGPDRRQRAGALRRGPGPRGRRVSRSPPPAHGPEGFRPFAGGPAECGPGPQEARSPMSLVARCAGAGLRLFRQ